MVGGTGVNLVDLGVEESRLSRLRFSVLLRYDALIGCFLKTFSSYLDRMNINKYNNQVSMAKNLQSKPKRPLSAFFLFSTDNRTIIKKDNPQLSIVEITKKTAQNWLSLSGYQKNIYYQQAAQEKEKYDQQVKQFEGNSEERIFNAINAKPNTRGKKNQLEKLKEEIGQKRYNQLLKKNLN